ncbi:sarcoplasmic calcium-binding protein-like [Mercenaria mercenaria]|uniref:sarcoplasmic calcium-binding protein-like n=1 Tax=Mercenaria mercenaria TaxID=6596 RepID=UPI00234F2965|nr:sarcoplasmic calcium-binding protein-like [Mercenaria mercenaria]XP_045169271.2 sarcoplasmic calcium-binding protein-like [Mercenaria mercenaria]XP_045169272.2 sarcoplasmic calcium-binding protein-like [Mercenaria mercenaria]XP_045169273.2 sarcoplasmic calcium-binding protein-like [Mercenaria mercenaria]
MANDYLIYKWTLWFRMFDSKSCGKIAREDAREEEELFAKLNHIEAERKKEVISAFEEFWEAVVFQKKPGPITEKEFIEAHRQAYRANKDEFIKTITTCYETLFDIFDVSRTKTISCEEFINGLKAFHHDDITLEKTYFESYHPKDGKVPAEELVNSWVKFVTCNDSTQRDYVKEALENGL